jgi:hypothetical protein
VTGLFEFLAGWRRANMRVAQKAGFDNDLF